MNCYHFKDVLCPFFKRYNRKRQTITCEGLPKSATANMMLFENADKLDRYFFARCCEDYRSCPVAQALYEKYEEKV